MRWGKGPGVEGLVGALRLITIILLLLLGVVLLLLLLLQLLKVVVVGRGRQRVNAGLLLLHWGPEQCHAHWHARAIPRATAATTAAAQRKNRQGLALQALPAAAKGATKGGAQERCCAAGRCCCHCRCSSCRSSCSCCCCRHGGGPGAPAPAPQMPALPFSPGVFPCPFAALAPGALPVLLAAV